MTDIQRIDEPTRTVAVHRRTIAVADIRDFYDRAYGVVVGALSARGAAPAGPAIGWYHAPPSGSFPISAGFPVAMPTGPLAAEVEVVPLPGGPALVAVHEGSYDGLQGAWHQLTAALDQHGTSARGDFWEEYLTEPTPDGDPAQLRTRLVLPLA